MRWLWRLLFGSSEPKDVEVITDGKVTRRRLRRGGHWKSYRIRDED